MTQYDKLWNYNDPAGTEIKFQEALKNMPVEDISTQLQLLTQIARTQGLQRKFEEAHNTLNEVELNLSEEKEIVHIRYFLERGRVFNSSGNKQKAEVCFRLSLDVASLLKEDFYAVDALHMLAIVSAPDESIKWNEQAILFTEESKQERAKNWLGSLYNNLGWSYFDKSEFEKALSVFLRALKWRKDKAQIRETFLAKWCVARTLRALNKIDDAIKIQLALFEESANGDMQDGYVYEELAELYLLKNDPVSKMYFQFAYTELSKDERLVKNEAERIKRLRQLSL